LFPLGSPSAAPTYAGAGAKAVYLGEAAPYGLLGLDDEDEFTKRYLSRLDAAGIELYLRRFAEISAAHDERGLVFLCFEPAGEFCHRHLFARWIEERTCVQVRELGDEQLQLDGL
jgi:uncharacterized protein (DUF488 family)